MSAFYSFSEFLQGCLNVYKSKARKTDEEVERWPNEWWHAVSPIEKMQDPGAETGKDKERFY